MSNPNKLIQDSIQPPNKGWSSDTALHMASMHDNAEIYILGLTMLLIVKTMNL